MSRIKTMLDEIMDEMNYFRPLFEINERLNSQLEEETFEVFKGNYKTNISCKFTKSGQPVRISYTSEYIPSKQEEKQNQLQLQLDEAVEKEDYQKAAELQKELISLTGKETKKA